MSIQKTNDEELKVEKSSRLKPVLIGLGALLALGGIIALIVVIYVKSGYRTLTGSFDYSIKYYTRDYEFKSSSNSIDIFQIKEKLRKQGTTDSYIYVWTYSEEQDLTETLNIINDYDKTNLSFMNTTIGAKDYPAIFVSIKNDKGDYQYVYFLDYNGHHIGIQTSADKAHSKDIEDMLASFTIIE